MKRIVLACMIGTIACNTSYAQTPFNTMDSVTVNNISATVLVHGDMWWNPLNYTVPLCVFPKETHKSVGGPGTAIWLSGYDGGGALHVSAQTYRQNGNDFWPGPLTGGTDTLTYPTSYDWAKIWKINRSDINFFLAQSSHTTSNTPPMILTWPGKGSSYARGNGGVALSVTTDMAPFIDVNGNGIYEPLLGDFPDIKGDQALWWVFSDNGPAHTESNGKPFKVEVHAMSYAYKRNTLIDDVVYYDYTVENKSDNDYNNFRLGLRADMELGYYLDDYIGFDSSRRLGIVYNGTPDDGALGGYPANSYGTAPPVAGVTLVSLPGDVGLSYVPAGSFTYYNNDASIIGNPFVDTQYNNYMRGRMSGGQHFNHDYTGPGIPTSGRGPGPITNYVFTGHPSDPAGWSECNSNNPTGDRRFILSSNDNTLAAGSSLHYVLALVVTDTGHHNACGTTGFSFAGIKTVADTAWGIYNNPPPPLVTTEVSELSATDLNIYPNPVTDVLHIAAGSLKADNGVSVINTLGQKMSVQYSMKGEVISIDVSRLTAGVYYCIVQSGDNTIRKTFVKL